MPDVTANPPRYTRSLLILFGILVIVRVVYLYEYHLLPDWTQLTVDNYYHLHWAESIASGNVLGDTTYFRAPFYVYCLAVLFASFGSSVLIARLFGIVAGLTAVLVTYHLGRRVFTHRTGLMAAYIVGLMPMTIYFEAELLLDTLFTLLVVLAMYMLVRWLADHRGSTIFVTGLLMGVAAITRPTILAFAPVVFLAVFLHRRPAFRVGQAAAFVAGLVLVIAPIFVRNVVVAHDPVMIASQGGINFYIGNNESADGLSAIMPDPLGHNWRLEDITYIAEKAAGRTLKPGEVSSYWYEQGLNWIGEHPGAFANLTTKKLYYNFSNREISNNRSLGAFIRRIAILRFDPLSFGIILPLAVFGALLAIRKSAAVRLIVLLIAVLVGITTLFFFNSRFRLPLLPFYSILAAYGISVLPELSWKHTGSVIRIVLILGLVGLFSFYPLFPQPQRVSTQDLLSKGLMYMNQGNYPAAVAEYRKAMAYDDRFPTTNLNLGISFMLLGQTDSAFYYLRREQNFHPLRPRSYIDLASLYLVNDKMDSAFSEIEGALAIRPYDVTANMILLRTAEQLPTISGDSLMKIVRTSAHNTHNDLYLLNEAAIQLIQRKRVQAADSVLRVAIESKPPPIETDNSAFDADFIYSKEKFAREKARSYYQLGYLLGTQGRFDESIKFSRVATLLDPDLAEAYINLVSGYVSLGQMARADSVLTAAESHMPTNATLQRIRGMIPRQ